MRSDLEKLIDNLEEECEHWDATDYGVCLECGESLKRRKSDEDQEYDDFSFEY